MKTLSRQHSRQHGFILVLTLWILAALTVAVGFFALWTEEAIRLARERQSDTQAEIDIQSTQATLIYLLTTQRMTVAGLTVPQQLPEGLVAAPKIFDYETVSLKPVGGEIRLDSHIYQGHGKAVFLLQDARGLLDINFFSRSRFQQLLSGLGISPEVRDPLLSTLEDYTDLDDLHRINGAERSQYEALDLPPPSNRNLRTPDEMRRVLGWSAHNQLWENDTWVRHTTTAGVGSPNVNTAPIAVLQTILGISAENAQRIVEYRQTQAFSNFTQLNNSLGISLPPEESLAGFYPSDRLRLLLWHEEASRGRFVRIWLTPFMDDGKPWQIEYTMDTPLSDFYRQTPDKVQTALLNPDWQAEEEAATLDTGSAVSTQSE